VAKKADAPIVATESESFSPTEFLRGTKEELDRVVWPSRQQLISESVAVVLMVTLSATLIYLMDNLFGWLAKQVFG
jgi:preprotein translocase subunit SecE